jgi:hypothetical protein
MTQNSRFTRLALALSLSVLFLAPPTASLAANGDCGQPSSNGTLPTAGDAFTILRTAVGLQRCGLCVCDLDGGGLILASDALSALRAAVSFPIDLSCGVCDGPSVFGTVLSSFGSLEANPNAQGDGRIPLPAPGVLVELQRIDEFGEELELLDTEFTDESGAFSFRASTGYGTDLMLRAFNEAGENILSALVVQQETDIDPAATAVLSIVIPSPILARGAAPGLANFTGREYAGCVSAARAISPTEVPTNVAQYIEFIFAATGDTLRAQIQAFALSEDLNDSLAGAFWGLNAGMFFEVFSTPFIPDVSASVNSRSIVIGASDFSLTFDGAGNASFGETTVTEFELNKTSGTAIDGEKINATVQLSDISETFTEPDAVYDLAPDGSIILSFSDGFVVPAVITPDFSIFGFADIENETSSKGRGFGIGFRQSSGADESLFSGNYHALELFMGLVREENDPNNIFREVLVGAAGSDLVSNGSGNIAFSSGPGVDIFIGENGHRPEDPPKDPDVSVSAEEFSDDPDANFTYEVGTDGAFMIADGGEVFGRGAVSPDGNLVLVQGGDQEEVGDLELFYLTFIKKGSGITRASVAGDYRILGFEFEIVHEQDQPIFNGVPSSNVRETCSLGSSGTLTLLSNGTFTLPDFVLSAACLREVSGVSVGDGFTGEFVHDGFVVLGADTEADGLIEGDWDVDSDGALSFDIDGLELSGAIDPTGSFFIARGAVFEDFSGGGTTETEAVLVSITGFAQD